MNDLNPSDYPHLRFNPLHNDWILVSPYRAKRPWQGHGQKQSDEIPGIDVKNPLRPGVTRPNGKVNPDYKDVFVFDNDFPPLMPEGPDLPENEDPLFQKVAARGKCRVICYHPRSDFTLSLMDVGDVRKVVDAWVEEMKNLSKDNEWVQIFENRGYVHNGVMMDCSNLHPHCQVWASSFLPNEPTVKQITQKDFKVKYGEPMLVNYLQKELKKQERIVIQSTHWVWLVPHWAAWPFETMLLPRRHVMRLQDLSEEEKCDLSKMLKDLHTIYDNLFECSFPYSMGWHGAPTGKYLYEDCSHWQLHALYFPPLLGSATMRKNKVGYDLFASMARDLTPEQAADKLKSLPGIHYKHKSGQ